MRFTYMKFSILLISAILIQSLALAGEPTDQFIIPKNAQKDQAFHMVVIGDSVAWGNGLNRDDKYYYIVAEWLHGKLSKPIEVTVYAHSCATIVNPTGALGKSTNANLNSWYPTLMDQAYNIDNIEQVDLILVSGGINDVGVLNILDVYTSADIIRDRSDSIYYSMRNLLSYLLSKNEKTKIIITNYYPIISEDTDTYWLSTVYSLWVLINPKDSLNKFTNVPGLRARLRENSYAFSGNSLTSLTNAIEDTDNGANRISLAMVNFKDSNSYAASDTWLWKLKSVVPPKTDDDFYEERAKLCKPIGIANMNFIFDEADTENYINYINAMGHPNKNGSIEYARAIKSAISANGPDWLKKEVQATSIVNDETVPATTNTNNFPDITQWLKSLSSWASMWTDKIQNMLSSATGWPLYIAVIVLALIIGGSLIRKSLWDFIINAISGLVVIYLSSTILGIGISITIPTLLVCAIGGFPGAIILITLKYFYGITF